TGDASTNEPVGVASSGLPCRPGAIASANTGYVPIGPEGDGIATGQLSSPIPGGTVTSEFGYRPPPCAECSEFHPAIDIDLHDNSPILAADGGTVDFAEWNGGYGYQVFVDHGNGLGTWYAHLSQMNVRVGDKVRKGQQIAVIGRTGLGTGIHLDFGVIEGYQGGNIHSGTPVNPRKYVRF
ncbi:M23 family metallopeptidase, partial [Acaryochloris marina NIES-2412]|uniref:M23 family metallopeptidase n=1 Tax=Acaryochloris marina TaxID=155978 RepID=UPI0040590BA1